jgi:hypothetical protein
MLRVASVCVLLLYAMASRANDAQTAAIDYVTALGHQDFAHAARLIRAADLVAYKKAFDDLFRAEAATGRRDLLVAAFGPDAKLDDALNAKPDATFIATMNVVMGAMKSANMKLDALPPKYLGQVSEDAHLVHVLVRTYTKLGDATSSRVEVVSTAFEDGSWKVVLPEQIRAIAQVMQRQMAAQRGARP